MRHHLRQRRWLALAGGGLVVLASLLLVHYRAPDLLTVALAVSGIAGGLFVLYEVRLTKQIAQAEFIRDLNSGFFADEGISTIWRKLLLEEEISEQDRHHLSAYLTFFETLRLLLVRNVVEFDLVDDLFRNRFFRALGSRSLQEVALVKHAGAFENVHALASEWSGYLREAGRPVPQAYHRYRAALLEADGLAIVRVGAEALDEVLELQTRAIESMPDAAWLRANDPEMLLDCLQNHHVMGVRADQALVALAILYDGGSGPESLRRHFTNDAEALAASCNLKVVIVDPRFRRRGLGQLLVEQLEMAAQSMGKRELLCTIHRRNRASQRLFTGMAYRRVGRVTTSYGDRLAFALRLPD